MISLKNVGNVTIKFDTGAVFHLEMDDDLLQKLQDVTKRVEEQCSKTEDATAQANLMLDAIDEMLGQEATTKIFAGLKVTRQRVYAAYIGIATEVRDQYANSLLGGLNLPELHGMETVKADKPTPSNVLAKPRLS